MRAVRSIAFLSSLAAVLVAAAEPALKVRVVEPSRGMSSDDLILYTADATEYGADRTGKADSTSAIQSALDACDKVGGGTVFLPAGRYRVEGRIVINGGSSLRGEWVSPAKGGLGKGTILMAFAGRGVEKPDDGPFVTVKAAATLRDIGIWYPEQSAASPVPYPATIYGRGHSTVFNVTLYNSWTGFWNNTCSSMLIRRLYGTVLKLGIHGAYAYDIPRIEHVSFDPRYWAGSGLPGAPGASTLGTLGAFLDRNLTGIQGGEQDWGYWWDIEIDHCQKGLYLTAIPSDDGKKLVPGNICVGNVRIKNAGVGVFVENAGYPGFMMTYGDISARICPLYFSKRVDRPEWAEMGLKQAYQSDSSLLVTGVNFHGGKYCVGSMKEGPYAVNFADCTFSGYSRAAVRAAAGSVICSRCTFRETDKSAFEMSDAVVQLVAAGNKFKAPFKVDGWNAGDERIFRDDAETGPTGAISYAFDHVSTRKPATKLVFDVLDSGAVRGTIEAPPAEDSTAAFQRALDRVGAAKGGTVYVPAGVYRLEGSLVVPSGVELRGSFEGAHYGNGTHVGTQLWAYGGKNRPEGAPLVTMRKGSGLKGFTIYYPDQGWTNGEQASEAARVRKYPPTVRTASDCWVQNCCILCCWTAIDAMTVKSDNLELVDVTGAALGTTLEYGHGATGGVVRDVHFNYSNWTHQGRFPNRPRNEKVEGSLGSYTGRNVKGMVLGDVSKTAFFSCFNIIVADQITLIRDPHTGGSFRGKMWGVAFDAAHNGVVGKSGCSAVIGLIASMGVFNQAGGGHYAVTEPGFKGRIVFSNADVWSGYSRIADLSGGSVTFSQLLSWCCFETLARDGAEMNIFASTYVGDHVGLNDKREHITYEKGAKGSAAANVECRRLLSLVVDPEASVKVGINGVRK